jgi:hypothetical protein
MRPELNGLASATEPEWDIYQRKALAPPQALSVPPQLRTEAAEAEVVVAVVEAVEAVVVQVAHLGQERADDISSSLTGEARRTQDRAWYG